MSNSHLPINALESHQWRESVLSTRSISYVSTADLTGSPGLPPPGGMTHGRSISRTPALHNNTMTESDPGLEMGGTRERELNDIPELPESVAESLLFTLPREIRDRIYQFCLAAKDNRQVEWPVLKRAFGLQPQLVRTCKIIYDEAAPLLYTLNTMTFHHPSDSNMFVRAASSPHLARHISYVSLHIRVQDTRLWMPYLTSKDTKRSLKADFPNLRDLNIRFRSNKWQHGLSPDHNMRLWSEDSRLDEVVDGLRHVYLHTNPRDPKTQQEFETDVSNHADSFSLDPSDPQYKKQWLDIHNARAALAAKTAATPTIKVVCACRVHVTHFNALTGEGPPVVPPIAPGALGLPRPRTPPEQPPTPVQEGEPFRGFSALDLRHGTRKLHDPDLGSANVVRTPFADKEGILLALEIHCLDPKRGDEGRTGTA